MAFALSTVHQIGLATTGALFIAFALVSSFVLPRRDPNFPGRGRNWYLLLSLVFFAAMMSAVVVFGREEKGKAEALTSLRARMVAIALGAVEKAVGRAVDPNALRVTIEKSVAARN